MESKRIGLLSIVVAFILLFIIELVHHEESLSKKKGENPKSETLPILDKSDCKNGKKSCKTGRSAEYCYLHREKGSEGSNSGASNAWKLAHVVINLRHGDRTSIHSLENTSIVMEPILFDEVDQSQYQDSLKTIATYQLNVLNPKKLRNHITPSDGVSPLSLLFRTPDRLLLPGQLTSRGFSQLADVGAFLRPSYLSLLSQISPSATSFNPDLISIRSTNYNRTIQSVASFMSTLLPGVSNIPISYYLDHKDEFMLGSLKHLVPHDIDEEPPNFWSSLIGKTPRQTGCPRAELLLNQMHAQGYSVINQTTMRHLIRIFGEGYMQRFTTTEFITELADVLLPQYCHNHPLPCNSNGDCVTEELLHLIMKEADQSFCSTYTSEVGGYQYTLLDIHPFMMEMREALVNAAESPEESPLIHVFAGHDTVIAPVLSALGVYHSPAYCVWPHYASRLSFELWTNRQLNSNDAYYLRLVYNGDDATSLIPSCSGKIIQDERASFCPFDSVLEQFDQLLSPYRNRKRACLAKK